MVVMIISYSQGMVCSPQTASKLPVSPTVAWGRESKEKKQENFVGQDKNSLKNKGGRRRSDAKAVTYHFPQADQCPVSLQIVATLERPNPQFYC